MFKKIVVLDTSFLTAAEKGDIDIEKEYPKNEYIRFVQDTVIDEFFLDEQNRFSLNNMKLDYYHLFMIWLKKNVKLE